MNKWRVEDSAELYNIGGWGLKYFAVNEAGHVTVTPKQSCVDVDLMEVMQQLQERNVAAPVLLRFPDILDNRIEKISACFKKAAKEYEYQAENFIIYPIKVNQMRQVVEEIVSHGRKRNIGLEAGSKPELHAVLGVKTPDVSDQSLVICNGYKDKGYIELALLAQKMGRRIFLVVEKPNELRLITSIAQRMGIRPNLGMRIKLSSSGSGKWEESGGDRSKFGLNTSELFNALDFLQENNMTDCLKLIHFHIGSQVTNIRRIKNALREAAQFYVQLSRMGCELDFIDIGGGLGVDYDGTRSSASEYSMNYSIQEYVNDAVYNIVDAANKNELKHPNIITESGRSLTAHHSVLVHDVMEATSLPQWDDDNDTVAEQDSDLVKDMFEIYNKINKARLIEDWHDALQIRDEALNRFSLGMLDLRSRALVEKLFWSIAREVNMIANELKHAPEELRSVARMLPDKYFCNFSLFQSLPDAWAIDQVFPVMPLGRLNERPDHMATLQDITCDSDGKLANFISQHGVSPSLPVHSLRRGEHYYIGVFLVGAYQEILGDLHNLFGDTNAVHINVHKDGYDIDQVIEGETVLEVLDYVEFKPKELVHNIKTWVNDSVKAGNITADEGNEFIRNYQSGLYSYTYLEK